MNQNSIWEIKDQECLIQTQFQTIFQEQSSNMTCMTLNHFKASMLCQKSSNILKQDALMEYDQKMDMHVRYYELQPQNFKNGNLHATIKLQFNHNEPKHNLVL